MMRGPLSPSWSRADAATRPQAPLARYAPAERSPARPCPGDPGAWVRLAPGPAGPIDLGPVGDGEGRAGPDRRQSGVRVPQGDLRPGAAPRGVGRQRPAEGPGRRALPEDGRRRHRAAVRGTRPED